MKNSIKVLALATGMCVMPLQGGITVLANETPVVTSESNVLEATWGMGEATVGENLNDWLVEQHRTGVTVVNLKMTSNMFYNIVVPKGMTVNMNTNGYTLEALDTKSPTIINNGAMSISGEGKVELMSVTEGTYCIENNGALTLGETTFEASYGVVYNTHKLTIDHGARFDIGKGQTGITSVRLDEEGSAVPLVTINDGLFEGGTCALYNGTGSNVMLNGGTFSGQTSVFKTTGKTFTIEGGKYDFENTLIEAGSDNDETSYVSILKGEFTNKNANPIIDSCGGNSEIHIYDGKFTQSGDILMFEDGEGAIKYVIEGGSYSNELPNEYAIEGLEFYQDTDDYWKLRTLVGEDLVSEVEVEKGTHLKDIKLPETMKWVTEEDVVFNEVGTFTQEAVYTNEQGYTSNVNVTIKVKETKEEVVEDTKDEGNKEIEDVKTATSSGYVSAVLAGVLGLSALGSAVLFKKRD